jgi:phage terminase large subunit-like protein
MILMVPQDAALFPTLGPQVCDFMQQNLIFGPGDLRGQPLVLDHERRFLIYRMYEVFPKGHRLAGRRRFQRCGISLPKGLAKTETAALVAACELHPEAPVRCTGFTKKGEPIGGPVKDPYIPMVAYTQEQSDDLAYGALLVILQEGPLQDDFDIGLERIMRKKGDGKAESLSTNPSARDGARTTFSVMDETHRWTLPRQKQAHQTMVNNLPKRKLAQSWMLEITTAPEPGAGSVAESTMEFARSIEEGKRVDASMFFFHRQAGDQHDLTTREGQRDAVIEASGAAAAWRDIDGIVNLMDDPGTDAAYWERVWCNRLVKGGSQAFDVRQWETLKAKVNPVKPGDLITLGFDGAMFFDSTGIVATHVETGFQWKPGVWERPATLRPDQEWQVPADEVDAKMHWLFTAFNVWRLYADPPYWQSWIAKWRGLYGEERVNEWWTARTRQMTAALENFITAITEGTLSHDGDPDVKRHLGNSRKKDLPGKDEDGKPQYLIQKERPKSPNKIDLAMCATLSWEARTDAIASGVLLIPESVYQTRGALSLEDYLEAQP